MSQSCELPPRCSSFKLHRKKAYLLDRSASVREKGSRRRRPVQQDNTMEYRAAFKRIQQGGQECVNFSIGGNDDDTDDEVPCDSRPVSREAQCQCSVSNSSITGVSSSITAGSCSTTAGSCNKAQCLLKISSKAILSPGETDVKPQSHTHSGSVNVRNLVGTFEDIGSSERAARPLTVHVDSFRSDEFANIDLTESSSPLRRSQSQKGFKSDQSATVTSSTNFCVTNINIPTQTTLQPYWKLKRESLMRSCSASTMTSKDVT